MHYVPFQAWQMIKHFAREQLQTGTPPPYFLVVFFSNTAEVLTKYRYARYVFLKHYCIDKTVNPYSRYNVPLHANALQLTCSKSLYRCLGWLFHKVRTTLPILRNVWPDSCKSQCSDIAMWHKVAGVAAQCEGERTLLSLYWSKIQPCHNIRMSCRSWMLTTAVSHR